MPSNPPQQPPMNQEMQSYPNYANFQQQQQPGQNNSPVGNQQYESQQPPQQGNYGPPPPMYPNQQQPQQGNYGPPAPMHPNQQQQPGFHPQQQPAPQGNYSPQQQQSPGPATLDFFTNKTSCQLEMRIDTLDLIAGVDMGNQFNMVWQDGSIGVAIEESNILWRRFLKTARPFTQKIYLQTGPGNQQLIFDAVKPYKFIGVKMDIEYQGQKIAEIKRVYWRQLILQRRFEVFDAEGEKKYLICGSDPVTFCCGQHPWSFEIRNLEGEPVGKIQKKFSGFLKECCSNADNFYLEFDLDIPNEFKAAFLGALFLIEVMYFTTTKSENN